MNGGERAVILNKLTGVQDTVVPEGTHLLIPFIQTPHHFDVRTRPRNISSTTGSKDLQTVNITLRVLCRPVKAQLPAVFKDLGTDHDERILPSIGNEVLKSIVAQYDAAQLITQRETVSQKIRDVLRARAQGTFPPRSAQMPAPR